MPEDEQTAWVDLPNPHVAHCLICSPMRDPEGSNIDVRQMKIGSRGWSTSITLCRKHRSVLRDALTESLRDVEAA